MLCRLRRRWSSECAFLPSVASSSFLLNISSASSCCMLRSSSGWVSLSLRASLVVSVSGMGLIRKAPLRDSLSSKRATSGMQRPICRLLLMRVLSRLLRSDKSSSLSCHVSIRLRGRASTSDSASSRLAALSSGRKESSAAAVRFFCGSTFPSSSSSYVAAIG